MQTYQNLNSGGIRAHIFVACGLRLTHAASTSRTKAYKKSLGVFCKWLVGLLSHEIKFAQRNPRRKAAVYNHG